MLDRVRTTFVTLATDVTSEDAIIASNALVVTVGCLAMYNLHIGNPVGVSVQSAEPGNIDCQLDDASLCDNTFTNLTMAFYGLADVGTLRLTDNCVTQCIGGFWLLLTGWQVPQDPKALQLFEEVWTPTAAFEELLLLDVLGLIYPFPQGSAIGQPKPVAAGPTSLFVNGNQTEPVPQSENGSTALLILGNRPVSQTVDNSVSLLISGNRLRSRSGPQAATALLLVPEQERCAITGNLILSESRTGSDPGPSLWIVPDSISTGTELLSVVGNVLQGRSDLSTLMRAGITPVQSWAVYNAMPS